MSMEGPQPAVFESRRSIPAQHMESSLVRFLKSRLPGEKTARNMKRVDALVGHIPENARELVAKIRPVIKAGMYAGNCVGTYMEAMLVATIGAGAILVGKSAFINRRDIKGAFGKFMEDAKIKKIPENLAGSVKKEVVAFGASPRDWLKNAAQAKPTYDREPSSVTQTVVAIQSERVHEPGEVVAPGDQADGTAGAVLKVPREKSIRLPALQNRERLAGSVVNDEHLFNAMFKGKPDEVPEFLRGPVQTLSNVSQQTLADFTERGSVEDLLANPQFDEFMRQRCEAVQTVLDRAKEQGAIVYPDMLMEQLVPVSGMWSGNIHYVLDEIVEQRPEYLPKIRGVLQSLADTVAAHQPTLDTERRALQAIKGLVTSREVGNFSEGSAYQQLYLPVAVELRAAYQSLNQPEKYKVALADLSKFIDAFGKS